ncbi:MAG: hypothetical protein EXQ52_07735 [Bryobacterales bacterium]|nr:hypothetical protein [Bryobacterales bacterium]
MIAIEKANYKGWANCYRISNGEAELIITSDIGPRIMRYGFAGGQNLLKEVEETLGQSGEEHWVIRGGHRIWIAPEHMPRTYAPDNDPVKIKISGDTLKATQQVERYSGIEKRITVKMAGHGTGVEIVHGLRNATPWPVELAAWALTMMAPGGTGISGFPPRGTHPEMLAPTNPLVMWAFTNLADNRWKFSRKYFTLRQDAGNGDPQKIGSFHPRTWGAYLLGSELFVKRYDADVSRTYPDMGCSFEMFTNADTLELETLSPMTKLEPGESLEHTERWTLDRNIELGDWSDGELDRIAALGESSALTAL